METRLPGFYIPSVIERKGDHIGTYDLLSRLMEDRIIVLADHIDSNSVISTIMMLLYLDVKDKTKPIKLYINSPGGSIIDGLALIDTMNMIHAPVHTVCVGMAASMGAVILSHGERGHRYVLPHSEVMIHQAAGNASGKTKDAKNSLAHQVRLEEELYRMLSNRTGKTTEEIAAACDIDRWMTAKEAIEFGLADKMIEKAP